MAWTSKITLDDNKLDVGLATAIWNEGQSDEFRYSERVQMNAAGKAQIVTAAKAALAAYQIKTANEANYESILTSALNA